MNTVPPIELLPCPFCSGKARVITATHSGYTVACDTAGCFMYAGAFTAQQDREDSISRWNARTIPEPVMSDELWECKKANGEIAMLYAQAQEIIEEQRNKPVSLTKCIEAVQALFDSGDNCAGHAAEVALDAAKAQGLEFKYVD